MQRGGGCLYFVFAFTIAGHLSSCMIVRAVVSIEALKTQYVTFFCNVSSVRNKSMNTFWAKNCA